MLLLVPEANAQAPQSHSFNIAPQPLSTALRQFADQSGVQLAYRTADLQGINSPGFRGRAGDMAALSRLLLGTGVAYSATAQNTVTIARPNATAVNGVAPAGAIPLDTINVQGDNQSPHGPGVGYVATRSATATKSDTPIIETPQSISVVTRQQMEDQNAQSVSQALRYTSGVVPEQRGANTDSLEYLYSRGFQIDEYQNGLILPSSVAGFNITSFDPYLLDRVELLKGPASVLYGQASPGGILNLDSKRPTDDPLHEIMLQTGSYGRIQGAFDVSDKLNADGTLLGRITGDSFDTGTQANFIREQRIAIAPSLTWRPDANTNLTIFGNYQYDPEAGFYNFVPPQGTVLPGIPISRSFNAGDPSYDHFSKEEASIGYSFSHKFDETWSIYQDFRYLYNKQTIDTLEPVGLTPDGSALIRQAYHNQGTVNAETMDTHAQAKFQTGPFQHTATFGVDLYNTDYDHIFQGDDAPNLSIANPQYYQAIPKPTTTFGSSGNQNIEQAGVYAQDQIRFGHWVFLAGIREDFANERSKGLTTGDVTDQSDAAFTWRTGLVYLFDSGFAPYASYSTSFQPTIGTGFSGTAFQPTTGQQYEAGVKYQPPGSNSFVTASVFNLTEQNVLTADPDHVDFQVQTGEVRSRGVELEAHATLTDELRLIGSYTYTDLVNTKSNSADLGKAPPGIPANMASAWLTYDTPWQWSRGLQIGGGIRYLGSSWGDDANTFKVPSATLFDLAIHYDLGKALPSLRGFSFAVTASNLFDKSYISYCDDGLCAFGAGRVVLANLKYRW
ncbi:TonB-dependent siderophore receptor [Methylocapsa sp. S129]|uniref:TonB-dependent siderophore receptor n=1 Tax=Methylocapsa sp. S129 TaxID=1641869 RepID=UPI00131DC5A1|nr:TonB-dependent siderophore receptor [Methylocapsa sp. S129]